MHRPLTLHRACARERGISLVELMVSVVLGLLVMAVLATVFANVSRARERIERASEQIENGRAAIESLSEELELAGYYGEAGADAGLPAALPDPCSADPAVWASAVPIHVQGIDAATAPPSCVSPSAVAGNDILTVRRLKACVAGVGSCDAVVAGQAYFQGALCANSPQRFRLGLAGTATFDLTTKDCSTPTGLRRYVVNTYFISADNGAGRAVPTLKRLEFDGARASEMVLAEGIEKLQLEYGIDTDGDGAPDVYVAAPGTYTYAGCAGCSETANWNNVVGVKIHVLARGIEPSAGYLDTKTYTLGADAAGAPIVAGPFNDNYRRHAYTAVVRLMNPSGRREKR